MAWKVDDAVALELGCLEIRRFFKHLQPTGLEKKANMDFLEKEIKFERFLPQNIINMHKVGFLDAGFFNTQRGFRWRMIILFFFYDGIIF